MNLGLTELAQEIQKIQVGNHVKKEIFEDFEELFETHSVKFGGEDDMFELENNSRKVNPLGSEVLGNGLVRRDTKKSKKMKDPSFNDMSMIQTGHKEWKQNNK